MSIEIHVHIDYNVLVRNKREHKENRTEAQVKDEGDHQTRADRDWKIKRTTSCETRANKPAAA